MEITIMQYQMISDNGGVFKQASIELRTTEMPRFRGMPAIPYRYESCLFSPSDSEVLGRYDTLSEAVEGHNRLSEKYGLSNFREHVMEF
jgi:hypothetical protein